MCDSDRSHDDDGPSLTDLQQTVEKAVLDRSTFVRLHDVEPLLKKALSELARLGPDQPAAVDDGEERPDQLDECFFLISLVYLASGMTQEAPAVYAQLAIIERLAKHLKEASLVACSDLESIDSTLDALDAIVARTGQAHGPELVALLNHKRARVLEHVADLRRYIVNLSPEQAAVHDRLVQIVRSLAACNTRKHFPHTEVKSFIAELDGIGKSLKESGIEVDDTLDLSQSDSIADRIDELFICDKPGPDTVSPDGRDLVRSLFIRTVFCARLVSEKEGVVEAGFDDRFLLLIQMRDQLEKMIVAKSWSVRETDLFAYMKCVAQIDGDRKNGRFVSPEGVPADCYTQRTLLYLVRKGFALIYQLLVTAEPVSEPLLPVYNQLTTLKQCLQELQDDGGVSSGRELYPFTLKLKSLDDTRTQGQFVVNRQVPEGQGPVQRLYDDCVDLIKQLWP